jgi:hypothetical protein
MKKITLLLSFLITIFFVKAQCDYTVDMQDAYGDGWNGASIDMKINGTVVTSFTVSTLDATAATGNYSTYTGDNVEFYFNSGTWDTEITFQITAPDGSSVGSYGPYTNNSGNDGSVWTGVSNSTCAPPSCLTPIGLSVGNITSSSVDISWAGGANATSYVVEYGTTGFTQGSGLTTSSAASSATISALASATDYDFYVMSFCGAADSSTWAGPISATTTPGCGDSFGPYCYGAGAYTVFTITAPPGDFVTIDIIAGETEVGYDNLEFYDGVGNTGNLLYSADGDHTGISVMSTTGVISMHIDGDPIWNCVDGSGGPYIPIELTITCTTPVDIDVAGRAVTTFSSLVLTNAPFTISGDLQNLGNNTITSMDINYSIDGGAANTENVSGLSLSTGDYYSFNHGSNWSPANMGTYTIDVWASNINGSMDMNTTNDTVSGSVTVYANGTLRRPMLESFTSSTCGPCAPGNVNTAAVTSLYGDDEYSMLKYQMSWPGAGDPYYTDEGGDRRSYYNVSAVPDLVVDGNDWQGNSNSLTNIEIDNAIAELAFLNLSSNYYVDDQTVNFTVTIDPLGDFTGPLTLYSAIFEYNTYDNIGSNGEFEFTKVMKKMVPGSGGFDLGSLNDGQTVTESFSHTFAGSYRLPSGANDPINHLVEHSVEDFNNLGVISWIQDDASKEIFQSTVAVSTTGVKENITNALMIFPNPTENITTIAFEGIKGTDVTIKLYNILGELIISENYTSKSNLDYYNLDVSSLNNGMYNLVLTVGKSTTTKKLQILK